MNGHWVYDKVPTQYLGRYEDKARDYNKKYDIQHFEMMSIVASLESMKHLIHDHAILI